MDNILKDSRIDQIQISRGHKGQKYSYDMAYINDSNLLLYFDIQKGEDDFLINPSCEFVDFKKPLSATIKKLTLAYLKLLDGVAIEAISRVGLKEFDHFLRIDPKQSSFSYYSTELYKILEVGEYISNLFVKKADESPIFSVAIDGEFIDLSFSEQIEFFEEFLAKYVYIEDFFSGQSFEFEDADAKILSISYSGEKFSPDVLNFIKKRVRDTFCISQDVLIKHNQE